jgi:hypothetical protein
LVTRGPIPSAPEQAARRIVEEVAIKKVCSLIRALLSTANPIHAERFQ